MADDQQLRDAIAAVEDPVLRRPLGELGMVTASERRRLGGDRITVSVPVPNYPMIDELETRIRSALEAAGRSAELTMDVMDDPAREALMAAEVNQEVSGVVENMSWFTGDDGQRYDIFGSGGGAALAEDLGVPLMARIPLLPAMREGADAGHPLVEAAPDSEAAAAFDQLADAVIARKPRVRTHPELVIR